MEDTQNNTSSLTVKADHKKGVQCPMCTRPHPLYRCETFKSKTVNERIEFVKAKRICFNCINSAIRCKTPECGKPHQTLLHLSQPRHERNVVHQTNNIEAAVVPAVPLAPPDWEDAPLSVSATASMVKYSEILLQIIPLKVIADNRNGLVDSGSDVTMIEPSIP